jgi:hypothetical protein
VNAETRDESLHTGKFAAIDIESGAYELDVDELAACDKLSGRIPDAQIWLVRVGSRYVLRQAWHPPVLDPQGKMLANGNSPEGNIGFPNEAAGIDHFLQALAKTAPRMTPEQLNQLRQALEQRQGHSSRKN